VSVQFGIWNFDDKRPLLDLPEKVNTVLAPYGPDDSNSYSKNGVTVLYRAFHTTKEDRREAQPYISETGSVLTWDGRLDNRSDFIDQFSESLSIDSADVSVVAAAYDRWGTGCFAKLIGDWTLSIWNPSDYSLILAKDPIGTHHLYYSVEKDQVTWCTILDPLVLFAGRPFALNQEYIAGWFSFFPAAHLTPYIGIDSVPPSCFVRLERGRRTISKYWDFDPGKRIRYRTDAEYEEHFRNIFAEAVRRRLRSDAPILAELSGGMDSSSIVCMADTIIARGAAETPRLDTLSYYNDSEPNWDEYPYFRKVEEKRGRAGCHIDVGTRASFTFEFDSDTFAATPGSAGGQLNEASRQFAMCVASQGNRVVLSGIGGDEVTGGVPSPTPELMDLLTSARLRALARQLKIWALNKRKPWFHLFIEAARGFFLSALVGLPEQTRPAVWLHPRFVRNNRVALTGYPSRVKWFGPLPSFQENLSTLDALRRQLACSPDSARPLYEKRYPYLDRSLLEFIYAIPREQIIRPGHRRSLMRRALLGIVPAELLNRRRKAYLARSLRADISAMWPNIIEMSEQMISTSLEILDPKAFCEAIHKARRGQEVSIVPLMRTLGIEFWLRQMESHLVFSRDKAANPDSGALDQQSAPAEPLPCPKKRSAS